MKLFLSSLFFSVIFLFSLGVQALPGEGSCVDHRFPGENSDTPDRVTSIDSTIVLRTLRKDVPVYESEQSASIIQYLQFDKDVTPKKQTSQRIQVIEGYAGEPLGWIERHDLLCQGGGPGANVGPLKVKGLPRKVFFKYQTDSPDFHAPVYSTPDRHICSSPTCEPIMRIGQFRTHFVFAIDEEQKRYLVGEKYMLSGVKRFPLSGWIDEERIIQWNTNLGLRPKNDADNDTEAQKINIINGYRTLEDSFQQNDKASVKLMEGNIWYTFQLHMPLIDRVEGHYRVAAPGVGMKGFKLTGRDADLIEALKRVDVFFVLDGTASMEPYIAQTKEVVQDIVYKLQQKQEFKETTFRFGFLVYRDKFADTTLDCFNGICEIVSLPNDRCEAEPSNSQDYARDFGSEIGNVQATRDDQDDYPEQLFAGIKAAKQAIASCGNNTKLVFIIGDHGDRERYLPQNVINSFKRDFQRLAIYFIQTPEQEGKSYAYRRAYQKFTEQANDFVEHFYSELSPQDRKQYFLKLKDNNLVEKVVQQFVAPYSNSGTINEIEMLMTSTGNSIKDIIQKYRKKGDFPVLYLDWIERAICQQDEEQCNQKIDHQVRDFYIPIKEGQMQEELVLIERHIDEWLALINPIVRGSGRSGSELREKFVEVLHEEIQNILNPDTPIEVDDKRTLREILESSKNALPLNTQSPLLQYSFNELGDTNVVPDCELRRLIDWLKSIRAILTKITGNPTLKVSYELQPYQQECPGMSIKGHNIKSMKFEQRQALGKDENYRYGHALGPIFLYWLPMDFLP